MLEGRTRTTITKRIEKLRSALWLGIMVLLTAYGWVQIVRHGEMKEIALSQAIKNRTTPAPRGMIFDRNGSKLVDNRRAQHLVIQPEDLPARKDQLEQIEALAEALGRNPQELARRIQLSRQGANNRLVNLLDNLDDMGLAQAEMLRARFPFLSIQTMPRRAYLGEDLAGHALGYVGEVDEKLMAKLPNRFRLGEIIGKSGFEASHNDEIKGTDGERRILVDHLGREISLRGLKPPASGRSAYLTIDAGLQQVARETFGKEQGAAVVIDLSDGGILAMYSAPSIDPNQFLNRMNQEQVDYFWRNPARPMLNRAIQGLYPPGSTFKLLMALAGLEKGVITPISVISCSGAKNFYGKTFRCEKVHGAMTLIPAIIHSCNSYFFEVGSRLDIDDIHATALKYGLVGKTGIDLPAESNSRVPSRAWKARMGKTAATKKWYAGETISVAIGQGDTALSPMALARFYGMIGSGGKLVTPHLLYGFKNEETGNLDTVPPPKSALTGLKPEIRTILDEGLYQVVQRGTAAASKTQGFDMCGKTGTAQVKSLGARSEYHKTEKRFKDHALFCGYAPRNNPQIAFAVVAENAGFGASTAAPIAKKLCQYWLVDRHTKPLPPPGPKPVGVTTVTPSADRVEEEKP